MLAAVALHAEYKSMIFSTATGVSHSLDLTGLEIEFTDGKLLALNSEQTLELPLAQMATMEFSENISSGIDDALAGTSEVSVYNLSGALCAEGASPSAALGNLTPGIYVMKYSDGTTIKILVK